MRGSGRILARYWAAPPISSGTPQGIFARIAAHDPASRAVLSDASDVSYEALAAGYSNIAGKLVDLNLPDSHDAPARIGLIQRPGVDWIQSLLGIWKAGYIAVPLSPAYPERALRPLLEDADITTIIADTNANTNGGDSYSLAGVQMLSSDTFGDAPINNANDNNCNMDDLEKCRILLYTSGTTGNPKGVIWSEKMIRHHVTTLSHAWNWSNSDTAIAALPLHHVHGIVNVILTALYCGAALQMYPKFDASAVWRAIMSGDITVFMGVPTMYRRLLEVYQISDPDTQEEMRSAARENMRLFVTGSAALPIQDAAAWAALTGSIPLERYGMTETGMTLSNQYDAEKRVPASLGMPLPGTAVRIADDNMLSVKGDGVSRGYWNNTTPTVDEDGWFETGDIVEYKDYKETSTTTMHFVGRQSVDIVKTAGYKVSALEIENMARCLGCVDQIAVVGVPDAVLGERIVAYVVVKDDDANNTINTTDVDDRKKIWKNWRDTLPKYKVPRNLILVDQLPRNQLGKIQKVELKRQWALHLEDESDTRANSKMQQ